MATKPRKKSGNDAAESETRTTRKMTTRAAAAKSPARAAAAKSPARAAASARETAPAPETPAAKTTSARGTSARGRGKARSDRQEGGVIETVKAVAEAPAKAVRETKRAASRAATAVKDDVAAATRKTTRGATKAKKTATSFLPDFSLPSLPTGEVADVAKKFGSQLVSYLNSDVGRVVAAEVLVALAASLTKAAANTETGKDTKEALYNAGAKIGAAAANAGAKMMDTGSAAASQGADAAANAAGNVKDVAREMAQVAVSAVGGVVADAAKKVIRRGRPPKSEAPSPIAPPRGTPRPPQI
jgi:hypothetical protein